MKYLWKITNLDTGQEYVSSKAYPDVRTFMTQELHLFIEDKRRDNSFRIQRMHEVIE